MGRGNCRRKEHMRITWNSFWKSHLCPVPSPTPPIASGPDLMLTYPLLLSGSPQTSAPSEMGCSYPILKPQPGIFAFEKLLG